MEMCLWPDVEPTTAYSRGCRCIGCKDGVAEYWRKRKREQRERALAEAEAMQFGHGTASKFDGGCRCGRCRAYGKRVRARARRVS